MSRVCAGDRLFRLPTQSGQIGWLTAAKRHGKIPNCRRSTAAGLEP